MTLRLTRARTFGCIALAALLIGTSGASATTAQAASKRHAKPALKAFDSCRGLVRYARHNARRTRGRTGVATSAPLMTPQVLAAPEPDTASADGLRSAPMPTSAVGPTPDFSSTNVQEAGVDEPDIIKTDGKRVFTITDGTLRAIDVSGATPRLIGSRRLDGDDNSGGSHQLFLHGDRLLVMSTSHDGVVLSEIDVSDPEAMIVRRTLAAEGGLVDARLTGSVARIVITRSPSYIPRAKISRAGLRRFVPGSVLRSRVSGRTFRRSVVSCDDVRHPRGFSGLDLLTVMTIDLDKGLFDVERDAIMAGAQTVYASPTSLYVASGTYDRLLDARRGAMSGEVTEIHRFQATADGTTSYRASGQVGGFILNQFAMSEHEGHLRVASTEEPEWLADGRRRGESESFVTVLDERGSRLVRVGRVSGLGKGEEIYAVRFVGDKGYVVTFRQVDPLYTLDLSRASRPRVVGELKIRGYSAYLHPISDDLLLGVGQDATRRGATLGVQLSLFDVSDPAKPARRAHVSLRNAYSDAEFDHHAFLFWQPASLAVIPLSADDAELNSTFEGAVGFRVGGRTLPEAGRITHPAGPDAEGHSPIGRSLVVGERLYTLSYAGLGANRLDTLGPVSFTPFPKP